jgi:nucleoside-diphosphate-sugar epimerase
MSPVKNPQPLWESAVDSVQAVKLLVLGGTKFLGRATVEAALQRGHEVTLFNRGQTNPDLFPEVEKLRGDRTEDLSPLDGRSWDAVVDPSGYVPETVRRSVEALGERAGLYLFVSSVSVYADFSGPLPEENDLQELDPDQPDDRLADDFSNYGPLKALCERAVVESAERHVIVRPGLIVGPNDPTGRFTYWPHRLARGGEVLAPAPPDDTVQFVDVRDLADWFVLLCEREVQGTFNAARPGVSWSEFLDACLEVGGNDADLVWADGGWLVEQEVEQWMGLPMWIHDEEMRGIHQADVSRGIAAGLTFRPLEDTIRATLRGAETTDEAGLDPTREADLISKWKAR